MSIKVLRIKENTGYEHLIEKGTQIIKDCGTGNKGLSASLIINYLDQLILAQNTPYNSIHFFRS